MESFLGKLPEEKIIKAKELIESFKEFNETMPVLLEVLDNAMGDPGLSDQLISFLAENIDENSDVDELLDELENFLFELAMKSLVEKGYLTQEKFDEFFKLANKWILYSKISRMVKVLEEGLITRAEFDELLENRNPNLEFIDYLGTLINIYLSRFITAEQFKEIKNLDPEERKNEVDSLALEVSQDFHDRHDLKIQVSKGRITEDQLEKIMSIDDPDKRRDTILLITAFEGQEKLDRIIKYLYVKHKQNVSEIDMIDDLQEKIKKAIEILIDFDTANESD